MNFKKLIFDYRLLEGIKPEKINVFTCNTLDILVAAAAAGWLKKMYGCAELSAKNTRRSCMAANGGGSSMELPVHGVFTSS